MTDEEYYRIAQACDHLLFLERKTLPILAIPWLHVLNQHPVNTAKYEHLATLLNGARESRIWPTRVSGFPSSIVLGARRMGSLMRALSQAFVNGSLADAMVNRLLSRYFGSTDRVDVLIVSLLVNPAHLSLDDDFYFGPIQRILADQRISSLLALRNQTQIPAHRLIDAAARGLPAGRMILPDSVPLRREMEIIRQCTASSARLHGTEQVLPSGLDGAVVRGAQQQLISNAVFATLRLHGQVTDLCRRFRPAVVATLYEGHAWERCVWHAGRSSGSPVLCVAYQHTTLWKHAYAVKRRIGPDALCDPDLILTLGDVTREMLQRGTGLRDTRIVTYGTHRAAAMQQVTSPRTAQVFLVLPEGIESESVFLFEFALACARRLPEARFVFRTHPIVPFSELRPKLMRYNPDLRNVEVSERPIEDDFARAGYALYRGSSTAIYAVLAGLKPFYVSRQGEMEIDPLFQLQDWRERVRSVDDVVARFHQSSALSDASRVEAWERARPYCAAYIRRLNPAALEGIVSFARQVSRGFPISDPASPPRSFRAEA